MPTMTQELDKVFEELKNHDPILDTSLLFDKMRNYASECNHITEMGTRDGCSIFAFMAGLPETIMCYDIYKSHNIINIERIAHDANIQFIFYQQNTLEVKIEPTDLLFLDTVHTFDQVSTELILHADSVRKYILIHDTEVTPDCIPGMYVPQNDGAGVRRAISSFLESQQGKHWQTLEDIKESYGLMILSRKTNV